MNQIHPPTADFKHLIHGQRDRVVTAFIDFDHAEHRVGESWTYIGSAFLPYDDGLSLFVEMDTGTCRIRMQWRENEQGPIIDQLQDYVQEVR